MLESSQVGYFDDQAMHAIVYETTCNNVAVATGRIVFDGLECSIDNIAVLKEYRGKLYGDFTVRLLLSKAFSAGIKEVKCVTDCKTEAFFTKLGFTKIENEYKIKDTFIRMIIKADNLVTKCNKLI